MLSSVIFSYQVPQGRLHGGGLEGQLPLMPSSKRAEVARSALKCKKILKNLIDY